MSDARTALAPAACTAQQENRPLHMRPPLHVSDLAQSVLNLTTLHASLVTRLVWPFTFRRSIALLSYWSLGFSSILPSCASFTQRRVTLHS